jgi:hypothetical protein
MLDKSFRFSAERRRGCRNQVRADFRRLSARTSQVNRA